MREKLCALLDQRVRPGGPSQQVKGCRKATEIPDHFHEVSAGMHESGSRSHRCCRCRAFEGIACRPYSSRTRSIILWAARFALDLRA
jgi:hypothetical protein